MSIYDLLALNVSTIPIKATPIRIQLVLTYPSIQAYVHARPCR